MPAKKNAPKPAMPWQVDVYARHQDMHFILPIQFLLLCKVLNVTPHRMLFDFMDNLSCGSWNREGREEAKANLLEYILSHGYGKSRYSRKEIRTMFGELDALGMLYPKEADREATEAYLAFREKHHEYWFDKWFYKNNRSL